MSATLWYSERRGSGSDMSDCTKSGGITMIPKNIRREHITKAIDEVERFGLPQGRKSRKFCLEYDGKHYPPKYIISLVNKYASGEELDPSRFGGGKETNDFLRALGFSLRFQERKSPLPRLPSQAVRYVHPKHTTTKAAHCARTPSGIS